MELEEVLHLALADVARDLRASKDLADLWAKVDALQGADGWEPWANARQDWATLWNPIYHHDYDAR